MIMKAGHMVLQHPAHSPHRIVARSREGKTNMLSAAAPALLVALEFVFRLRGVGEEEKKEGCVGLGPFVLSLFSSPSALWPAGHSLIPLPFVHARNAVPGGPVAAAQREGAAADGAGGLVRRPPHHRRGRAPRRIHPRPLPLHGRHGTAG